MDKKLSIIIPIFNGIDILDSLLSSIVDTQDEFLEFVIVDDGSTDGTREKLVDFAKNCDIVLKLLSQNMGPGYARNIGVELATGEYVCFFDSDDVLLSAKDYIYLYDNAVAKGANVLGGVLKICDNNENYIECDPKNGYPNSDKLLFCDFQYDYGFTRYIYRKAFLLSNNLLFPKLHCYEDPVFLLRCLHCTNEIFFVDKVSYIVNEHVNNSVFSEFIDDLESGIFSNLHYADEYGFDEIYSRNIKRVFDDFGNLWIKYHKRNNKLLKYIEDKHTLKKISMPCQYMKNVDKDCYAECNGNSLTLCASDSFVLDIFNVGKWKKHASLNSLFLVLDIEGDAEIYVYHGDPADDNTWKILNNKKIVTERRFVLLECKHLYDLGCIFACIKAFDNTKIYGGAWLDICNKKINSTNISICFTTFNREKKINSNIENLMLNSNVKKINVIDNACSLMPTDQPRIKILGNKNVGGAGGFARGMIELLKSKEEYTHVVLMDDDVSFCPQVIDNLIYLLRNLKPEQKDSFIGGAMLRSDKSWFHVESGAKWKGLTVESMGYGLDMRKLEDVRKIDALNGADYNAWWFCCIPIKYIREDNLPLPLFFQWDDVDYGLRNKAQVITRSDIAVRHDPFDLKRTAMQSYYSNRNSLIVNSCHDGGDDKRSVLRILKKRIRSEVCLYRYEYADALNRAIEDYLKGPMWLCTIDPEKYNGEILKLNKPLSQVADKVDLDWYWVGCNIRDCDKLHEIVRKITFNGYLLKANRELTLPIYAERPVQGYRAKKILFFEENSGMGFEREKDIKKAISCMMKFQKLYLRMLFNYSKIVKEYRDKYSYMTSKEMWEKYLHLDDK